MTFPATLVIFEGGIIVSELEDKIRQVRQAVVLDNIVKAQSAGFKHIVLCTPYVELAQQAAKFGVDVALETEERDFHFGERLREVVTRRDLRRVLYMGGAAAPLITSDEFRYMGNLLTNHENIVIANNYYS